jgi:sulfur-oxidizing protein SoxX
MNTKIIALAVAGTALLGSSLPAIADADHRARALEIIKRDFKPRGQAELDRLETDGLQAICNRTGNKPPASIATQMQNDQLAFVKLPADGKLMGDWAKG